VRWKRNLPEKVSPPCGDVARQECQALRAILVTVIYVVVSYRSKEVELYLQTKLAVPSFHRRFFDGVDAGICLSTETDVFCYVFLSGPLRGILLSFVPHPWLISRLIVRLNDGAVVSDSIQRLSCFSAIQEVRITVIQIYGLATSASSFPLLVVVTPVSNFW
jgi:hypothetical protein